MNGSNGHVPADEENNFLKSNVLFISNLVRPFTLPGLKKVLAKYGKIEDDKVWVDKDKSKCYVVYENEEFANDSKQYINGLKWPSSNPNTLVAKFGQLEEMTDLIKKDEEERIQMDKERKEAAALAAAKAEEEKAKQAILNEEKKEKIEDDKNNVEENTEKNSNQNCITKSELREKTPPKNETTNVLFIKNLVRPFSVGQLKSLLNTKGEINEEKFWIDKIKSKCYAVYDTCEIALEARNFIHGLKWPSSNPKTLVADFGKLEEVNELLKNEQEIKASQSKLVRETESVNANSELNKVLENDKSAEISKTPNKDNIPDKHDIPTKEKTPAKNPATNILFIKNLVRPFTLGQLKELLNKDGQINEKRFWVDKIKSKCYATYENVEIAIESRNRLHGLKWPDGNQKCLIVDFSTEEELDSNLNANKIAEEKKKLEEENKRITKEKKINKTKDSKELGQQIDSNTLIEQRKNYNTNESFNDDEKDEFQQAKKRRRSFSPREQTKENKKKEQSVKEVPVYEVESPTKLLDDLFKKTKTTPSIYWMPLNENEVRLKEEKLSLPIVKNIDLAGLERLHRNESLTHINNDRISSPRKIRGGHIANTRPRPINNTGKERFNYHEERKMNHQFKERTRPLHVRNFRSRSLSLRSNRRSLSRSTRSSRERSRSRTRRQRSRSPMNRKKFEPRQSRPYRRDFPTNPRRH